MSNIGDNTQNRGDIPTPHVAEHIAGEDDLYGSESDEVILKNMNIPQDMITRSDLQEIIDGWEEKFNKLTEGVRAIEQGTHEVHAHMDIVMRNNRARARADIWRRTDR